MVGWYSALALRRSLIRASATRKSYVPTLIGTSLWRMMPDVIASDLQGIAPPLSL